jgi:hypothetical protein
MDKESLNTGVPLFEGIWSKEDPDSMILLNCQDKQVVYTKN